MNAQHAFDFDTTPEQVNVQRDDAMRQVAQHAEDVRPSFGAQAAEFVLIYLALHGPTSSEILTTKCKAGGIKPHDDRAFGTVYMSLAKRGLIEKVGSVRRERGHGTSGGNVWDLTRHGS